MKIVTLGNGDFGIYNGILYLLRLCPLKLCRYLRLFLFGNDTLNKVNTFTAEYGKACAVLESDVTERRTVKVSVNAINNKFPVVNGKFSSDKTFSIFNGVSFLLGLLRYNLIRRQYSVRLFVFICDYNIIAFVGKSVYIRFKSVFRKTGYYISFAVNDFRR